VTEKVIAERKEPLAECARCGTKLPASAPTGRPRIYCTAARRRAAYEDRRAGRPDAVKVQLVDRDIVQTIEKTIRRSHARAECVTTCRRTTSRAVSRTTSRVGLGVGIMSWRRLR